MHLAIPVLKREEPLVREVPLVESVVHGAAVAECPQGLATLVDPLPCGAGPRSHQEIDRMRRHADTMAHVLVEIFLDISATPQ